MNDLQCPKCGKIGLSRESLLSHLDACSQSYVNKAKDLGVMYTQITQKMERENHKNVVPISSVVVTILASATWRNNNLKILPPSTIGGCNDQGESSKKKQAQNNEANNISANDIIFLGEVNPRKPILINPRASSVSSSSFGVMSENVVNTVEKSIISTKTDSKNLEKLGRNNTEPRCPICGISFTSSSLISEKDRTTHVDECLARNFAW